MSKKDDIAQYLLQTLVRIKKSCEDKKIKSGIIDNISGLIFLVQKIRKHGAPKTIGFFGAQKRGKSSLINQLLGCELMPISPIPMSSVVIKVKHDESHEKDIFTVDIIDANGAREAHSNATLEMAQMLLREYGSHKGVMSAAVDEIIVTSNFSCSKILERDGILVDTPGAEIAFGDDEGRQDKANRNDAERAIKILSSMHIVVFVERADYSQSSNSKSFFLDHLKPMRPLSIINFKDCYSLDDAIKISDPILVEAKKESKIKETMLKTYGVNLDRTLCVSSKEAKEAKEQGDNELLQKSNLPLLEKRILDELQNLNPERGLVTCLQELKKILSQVEKEEAQEIFSSAIRPAHVFIEKAKALSQVEEIEQDNNPFEKIAQIAKEIYEQYN